MGFREWKHGSQHDNRVVVFLFFSSSSLFFFPFFLFFFISSPSPLFRPLVRPKNGGCYIDAWIDCSLASRYTDIQLIILVHTGEVSACDKSVNRWTPAERDGTRQTIRFPSMKFLRTKANTLFFQPEPSDFNFELASQRGVPPRLSSVPVIDQTPILPIDYYIVLRIYTTPAFLRLTWMRRICDHRPCCQRIIENTLIFYMIYRNRIWRRKRKEGKNRWEVFPNNWYCISILAYQLAWLNSNCSVQWSFILHDAIIDAINKKYQKNFRF